jgi:CheY-like chemotaxis protein
MRNLVITIGRAPPFLRFAFSSDGESITREKEASRIFGRVGHWSWIPPDSIGVDDIMNMNKHSVLILSDKNASVLDWAGAFRQRGLEVVSIDSPTLAIHHWRVHPPMLTVIDLSLPFEETRRACRSLRAISDAPILLVLPSASGDDILEAWRAGATECIVQPANPAVILLKALAWSMRAGWEWHREAPVSSPMMWETA